MEPWVSVLISGLVTLLINALFIHIAASILVKGKQTYVQAILAAFLGSLLASLAMGFIPGLLGVALGVLLWLIIVGAIYRTGLIKALLIGLFAGLIQWAVSALFGVFVKFIS